MRVIDEVARRVGGDGETPDAVGARAVHRDLGILLKNEGYEVETVQGGKAGLEALKKSRPDMVLADIRMPQVSGLDILAADMTPTLKRALKITFCDPWYYVQPCVFTKTGAPYQVPEDVNKPDITVGVLLGSTGETIAKQYLPKAKIKNNVCWRFATVIMATPSAQWRSATRSTACTRCSARFCPGIFLPKRLPQTVAISARWNNNSTGITATLPQ